MTLYQRYQRLTFWNKLGVIGSILGIILFIATVITWLTWFIPERPKSYPHLILSMITQDTPDDIVLLTNDFLLKKEGIPFKIRGMLFIPLKSEKTNLVFSLLVRNEPVPPVLANDLELVISFPKELRCVAGQDWQKAKIDALKYFPDLGTNGEQSWGYDFQDILPGLGKSTSWFQISPAVTNGQIYFSINLRAADCPPQQLMLDLMPVFLPPSTPPHNGFVIEGEEVSSNAIKFSVREIIKNLRK